MNGGIELDTMVSHTMPPKDINRAFELMNSSENIRSATIFRDDIKAFPGQKTAILVE